MLLVLFCMCMYRFAEYEKRRGWLWASINMLMYFLMQVFTSSTYIAAAVGFIATIGLMTLAIAYRPVNKGPFLP